MKKNPSTEQKGREKEADDFNHTLQEGCAGFDELIREAIGKFGKRLPRELHKCGQREEKKLMKFGTIDDSSLEAERVGHWETFDAFCLDKDIVLPAPLWRPLLAWRSPNGRALYSSHRNEHASRKHV